MLNKTQTMLIEQIHLNRLLSSGQLAELLNVSKRTIKNYVQVINEEYPGLIISSNQGYSLNYDIYRKVEKGLKSDNEQDTSGRYRYILVRLLTGYSDSISISKIEDDLFFSEATIRADINKIKEVGKKYNLTVSTKNNQASIIGRESDKRNLLTTALFNDGKNQGFDFDNFKNIFPELDLEKLYTIFEEYFLDYPLNISDYNQEYLFVYYVVTSCRIIHNHEVEDDIYNRFLREDNNILANKLLERVGTLYNTPISDSELNNLAVQIASISNFNQNGEITIDNLDAYLWKSCYDLVQLIADEMLEKYHVDLRSSPENFVNFALHIRAMIHRMKANIKIRNPYLYNIKNKYPLVFDYAVVIVEIIRLNYPEAKENYFSEDEIGYVALYMSNTYFASQRVSPNCQVLYVFPNYTAHQNLYEYYCEQFGDKTTSHLCNSLTSQSQLEGIDLVVMIQKPVIHIDNIPFIVVSPIKSEYETKKVYRLISKVRQNKEEEQIQTILQKFTDEKYFYLYDEPLSDGQDVLEMMTADLLNDGIVTEGFLQEVIHREDISETASGIVAFPHGSEHVNQSKLSVLISNTPIRWRGSMVKVVLLFAVKLEDYDSFFGFLLSRLIFSLNKANSKKQVLEAGNLEEFIDLAKVK